VLDSVVVVQIADLSKHRPLPRNFIPQGFVERELLAGPVSGLAALRLVALDRADAPLGARSGACALGPAIESPAGTP
jgi:hypothetical protein